MVARFCEYVCGHEYISEVQLGIVSCEVKEMQHFYEESSTWANNWLFSNHLSFSFGN